MVEKPRDGVSGRKSVMRLLKEKMIVLLSHLLPSAIRETETQQFDIVVCSAILRNMRLLAIARKILDLANVVKHVGSRINIPCASLLPIHGR